MIKFNKNLRFYTNINFNIVSQNYINFLIFKIFVGKITKKGKKLSALNFVYNLFLNLRTNFFLKYKRFVKEKIVKRHDGSLSFFICIKSLLVVFRIIRKRVGGTFYDLPVPLFSPKNALTKSIKSLVLNSYKRSEKNLILKLNHEIIDTLNKKSLTFAHKVSIYNTARRAMPFLHFIKTKTYRNKYNNFLYFKLRVAKAANSINIPTQERKQTLLLNLQNKLINYRRYKIKALLFTKNRRFTEIEKQAYRFKKSKKKVLKLRNYRLKQQKKFTPPHYFKTHFY